MRVQLKTNYLKHGYVSLPRSLVQELFQFKDMTQIVYCLKWEGEKAYFGWNGGISSGDQMIEIDSNYAKLLGLKNNQILNLERISNCDQAVKVELEPMTSDDWEILERNAEFVEQHLGEQLRIIAPHQPIIFRINSEAKIQFQVVDCEPKTTTCLRWTNQTEILVSPRKRKNSISNTKQVDVKVLVDEELFYDEIIVDPYLGFQDSELVRIARHSILDYSNYFSGIRIPCLTLKIKLKSLKEKQSAYISKWVQNNLNCSSGSWLYLENCLGPSIITPSLYIEPFMPIENEDIVKQSLSNVLSKFNVLTEGMLIHDGEKVFRILFASSREKKTTSKDYLIVNSSKELLPLTFINPNIEIMNTLLGTQENFPEFVFQHPKELIDSIIDHLEYNNTHLLERLSLNEANDFKQLKVIMRTVIKSALIQAPSVILLDDFDLYAQKVLTENPSEWDFILKMIYQTQLPLLLILTCQSMQEYSSEEFSNFKESLQNIYTLSLPLPDQRKKFLQFYLNSEIPNKVIDQSEGFTFTDLYKLVNSQKQENIHDLELAIKKLSLLFPAVTSNVPEINWKKHVGGYLNLKKQLKQSIEYPIHYDFLFPKDFSPSHLLFYGYSGTGKTLMAQSLASEFGMGLVQVKAPELMDKYIGSSEEKLRSVFEKASSYHGKGCILFIDEIESIVPRRGNDQTGVTDRMVNQMLTQLDGAEELKGVLVIGATTRPDLMDPALLRPGRLEDHIFFDFPTQEDRLLILKQLAENASFLIDPKILDDSGYWENLSSKSNGWTGADLKSFLSNAYILALNESIEKKSKNIEVNRSHLDEAFSNTFPSVSENERTRLKSIYEIFKGRNAPSDVGTKTTQKI